MGKTTFAGPVNSLAGYNTVGWSNVVNVASGITALTLTAADHGGRLIMLQDAALDITLPSIVTTEPGDKTAPDQVCNYGLTFRIYFSVDSTAVSLDTDGTDEFIGIMRIHAAVIADTDAFFAGTDVSIDTNGSTKGGLEGSYLEVMATSDGWFCSNSLLLGSGAIVTPFA